MNSNPICYLTSYAPNGTTIKLNRQRFESFTDAVKFVYELELSERDAANTDMCTYWQAQISIADGGLPGFYSLTGSKTKDMYQLEIDWRAKIAAAEEYFEGNISAEELRRYAQPVFK